MHPSRGATKMQFLFLHIGFISIHAPLAGCNYEKALKEIGWDPFQSMHPLRGATHALKICRDKKQDFNPCTPCGVQRYAIYMPSIAYRFQSMHPLRGATPKC